MTLRAMARLSFGFGALASLAILPRAARADEVTACVKASEQAQSLRDEGKYKKAREQLLVCTRDVCPAIVKKDCVQWLTEVDASMPSVVVTARDAKGQDLVDVKVTVDGATLTEKLDGKPMPLDPGEHTIRYETAGAPPVEEKLVMHAGEKNRSLMVKLGTGNATTPDQSSNPPPTGDTGKEGGGGGGPPIAAFVLGGIGVVAIGSFAFFGISGKSDVSDLKNTCAPNCEQSKVDSARTKLILADVSLGVGVVALGVATYLFLTSKSSASASTTGITHVNVTPVAGGGVAGLGGTF
jgi:hypothetical protein